MTTYLIISLLSKKNSNKGTKIAKKAMKLAKREVKFKV